VFRKIVTAVIVVPLAVIIVAFAVANRQAVTVSFDPFSAAQPAYAVTVPLFVLLFAVLILGVIVGGAAAWLNQSAWRRTARKLDTDMRALHDEIEALRRREPAPAERQPLPSISPPAP
jgi:uncharacterized integral membrane protein